MASLRPDPTFGAIRYRNGAAIQTVLVLVVLLALLALLPNDDPHARNPIPIALPLVAIGLAFYLYPLVRPTNVVTTSLEGIELRTFIGTRRTFVAWRDVRSVVLWTQTVGATRHALIGIERTSTAPPLPREVNRSRFLRNLNAAVLPPGVSLGIANTSVSTGKLDVEALTRLIASATDEVPVVDARRGSDPKRLPGPS